MNNLKLIEHGRCESTFTIEMCTERVGNYYYELMKFTVSEYYRVYPQDDVHDNGEDYYEVFIPSEFRKHFKKKTIFNQFQGHGLPEQYDLKNWIE